ncbi:hypothetical protein D915_009044 [Fasciola hepatica]|uniref:Uncharacterized protein n=1 Tax=Fasciola hepatica TaxID=6192 RepID=A0A4E0R1M1_FASHE|nr:hypothetical protein D915_009044 [Fasciola hepatica]
MRLWIHGWLRWNRSLRLCHGGGYAFDAAFYRERLCTDPLPKSTVRVASFLHPTTSATPYLGWLSDEAILLAESWATGDVTRGCLAQWGKNALVSELLKLASAWENSPDFSGS